MDIQKELQRIDEVVAQGPYRADWVSLAEHPVPQWFRRGKLGIFIHWGIYSVPAFGNEWYSRNMYDPNHREFEHHRKTYGEHKDFGYKDFIPMFRGERFDAGVWAQTFREAGAKFVVPVAEHHDGFAMYDTAYNNWNAVKMGPKVDVMAALEQACREQGLVLGASTHRAEHYFFMNMGRTIDSDVNDPKYADFYGPAVYAPEFGSELLGQTTENPRGMGPTEAWMDDWMVRTCELIDRYRPALLYFDWWIQNNAFKPWLKKLAAYYYNRAAQWEMDVTISFKHEAFPPGVGVFDVERGGLTDISPIPWETDTAIGRQSWGYRADNEYKPPRQIICDLIDTVSKNGSLLLNVGPRSDGTFTPEELNVLQTMGRWLKINGEGIYDTVPWKWFGEGQVNNTAGFFQDGDEKAYTAADFRYTYKGGCVYAFQMRPDGNDPVMKRFAQKPLQDLTVEKITCLGGQEMAFTRDDTGLTIHGGVEREGLPVCYNIWLR